MKEEIKRIKGVVDVPYDWAYGKVIGEFFRNLKDKKITGSVCKKCRKVFVPPQVLCGVCFSDVEDELTIVADTGYVETYTILDYAFPGQIFEPPYAVGIIKLIGTNTRLNHIINKESLQKLSIGSKVRAVWKEEEEREGSFFDIKYFEVVE